MADGDDEWKLDVKYSATQPRVPAGSPQGGQWTAVGGAVGTGTAQNPMTYLASRYTPTEDYRQKGFLAANGDFYAVVNHPQAARIALGNRAPEGSETALAQFLVESKAIRFTGNGTNIEIVAPVSRAQRDVVEMLPDWRNPMRVDVSNAKGRNLATFSIDSFEDMRTLLGLVPRILSQPEPKGGWEQALRFARKTKKEKR